MMYTDDLDAILQEEIQPEGSQSANKTLPAKDDSNPPNIELTLAGDNNTKDNENTKKATNSELPVISESPIEQHKTCGDVVEKENNEKGNKDALNVTVGIIEESVEMASTVTEVEDSSKKDTQMDDNGPTTQQEDPTLDPHCTGSKEGIAEFKKSKTEIENVKSTEDLNAEDNQRVPDFEKSRTEVENESDAKVQKAGSTKEIAELEKSEAEIDNKEDGGGIKETPEVEKLEVEIENKKDAGGNGGIQEFEKLEAEIETEKSIEEPNAGEIKAVSELKIKHLDLEKPSEECESQIENMEIEITDVTEQSNAQIKSSELEANELNKSGEEVEVAKDSEVGIIKLQGENKNLEECNKETEKMEEESQIPEGSSQNVSLVEENIEDQFKDHKNLETETRDKVGETEHENSVKETSVMDVDEDNDDTKHTKAIENVEMQTEEHADVSEDNAENPLGDDDAMDVTKSDDGQKVVNDNDPCKSQDVAGSDKSTIALEVEDKAESVRMEVEDKGEAIGIDEEDAEKVDAVTEKCNISNEKNQDDNSKSIETDKDIGNEAPDICFEPEKPDGDTTQTDFVDNSDNENGPSIISDVDPVIEEPIVAGKYTITHYNLDEPQKCCICEKLDKPKFVVMKEDESSHVCTNECLEKFKMNNADNYVEKILRLRSFATQEKKADEKKDEEKEMEFEWEADEQRDTPRKCGCCKLSIAVDNYVSWEAIDFCNEGCLLNYQKSISTKCAKCHRDVIEKLLGKFCVRFGNIITQFCSTLCLLSYKKAYKFCAYCQEDLRNNQNTEFRNFCSKRCMDVCQPDRITAESCAVCHQYKPAVVKLRSNCKSFCSEPCFVAYKFVNNVNPTKCEACPTHFESSNLDPVIYTEGVEHKLCSQECHKIFLIMNRKIVICGTCSVKKYDFDMVKLCENRHDIAFACSNLCLKTYVDKSYKEQVDKISEPNIKHLESVLKTYDFIHERTNVSDILAMLAQEMKEPIHKITITKPRPYVKQRNVATMCRPNASSKAITCRPSGVDATAQTNKIHNSFYVPIPMPIFVPMPAHLYVDYVPMPTPIPLPLPVPIFIPTSRKSIAGIKKEIQKIKNRVPADPLEAELLMMAERAAGDKKDDSSSESEQEEVKKEEPRFVPEATDTTAPFGEDVLSMALKMASDFEQPTEVEASSSSAPDPILPITTIMENKRKNIRRGRPKKNPDALPSQLITSESEKPDSNLCLKYTFGVNAWKQWVTTKNTELQKTQRRPKLFKTDILQLTADDLNFSLCLFVKEVRKPSGAEYAPDTIYYLCLGIQQFLYENGRIDNIFCDAFYEKFTDAFNEVCQKFANLYNDSQYIVTRVEEEHLWESKQLGAHSPLVLLNTLMFFNTKHFSLTTVDEHLQLSFSHIMKHWKRNQNQPGSRNVLLRFYPPQTPEGTRKKKVYEQQENDDNPLRCPVKLYEFYLSKCPESVKTRNDVFYLLPERSCVPDSPVWYSTMALDKEPLEKMLNRVKMVKEINVALLTT